MQGQLVLTQSMREIYCLLHEKELWLLCLQTGNHGKCFLDISFERVISCINGKFLLLRFLVLRTFVNKLSGLNLNDEGVSFKVSTYGELKLFKWNYLFPQAKTLLEKFITSILKMETVYGIIPAMNTTETWLLRSDGEEALLQLGHQQKKITRKRRRKLVAKRTSYKKEQ